MEASGSFWLWKNLENAAFQILGFRRGGEDGMIPALGAVFHLEQLHMGVPGGGQHHVLKLPGQHVLAAGAGDQVSPILHQLHAPQIDFLVAPGGGFHRGAGLGKGGRV